MDTLTKLLVDKAAAFSAAFQELVAKDNNIEDLDVEYFEGKDINGKFVRCFEPEVGYSSKYYYE